jgi:hypothetical protein
MYPNAHQEALLLSVGESDFTLTPDEGSSDVDSGEIAALFTQGAWVINPPFFDFGFRVWLNDSAALFEYEAEIELHAEAGKNYIALLHQVAGLDLDRLPDFCLNRIDGAESWV